MFTGFTDVVIQIYYLPRICYCFLFDLFLKLCWLWFYRITNTKLHAFDNLRDGKMRWFYGKTSLNSQNFVTKYLMQWSEEVNEWMNEWWNSHSMHQTQHRQQLVLFIYPSPPTTSTPSLPTKLVSKSSSSSAIHSLFISCMSTDKYVMNASFQSLTMLNIFYHLIETECENGLTTQKHKIPMDFL